jgi:ABC-2 type transport system permease protein
MWREFFKFDVDYQLRQPLLWVCAVLLALMAFGATTTDAVQVGGAIGNINRNAPVVVVKLLGAFTLLSMFIVTIFIAGAVLRDTDIGISDMLFATPMRKRDYLVGRFGAGMVACMFIFLLIVVGMMLGPLRPGVDAARVGPFPAYAYLWGLTFIVLPNLILVGSLLMLLAATTRSMLMVYVGVLGFFVLWIVAGNLTRDINNDWLAALADPFGMRALSRMTRYFSVAEANAGLPAFGGLLLANRALWLGVAVLMFGATLALFKPQRAGTGKRLFGKAKVQAVVAPAPSRQALPRIAPKVGATTAWVQCWNIFRFDAVGVFKSVPFLVMLLFGALNLIGSSLDMGVFFGTEVYPVTYLLLQNMGDNFNIMLAIILIFYAGELVFKERQAKIADVHDAMPVPDWAPLLAKIAALIGVVIGFMLIGALVAIGLQLFKGGAPIEPLLYLKGMLLSALPFVLMGLGALFLQVVSNNKYLGIFLMLLMLALQLTLGMLNLNHNLYNYAALPAIVYSDMNGYGHFLTGWSWFALYWSIFAAALMLVARTFWVRGLSADWRSRARLAGSRMKSGLGVALAACLLAFGACGGWIFYNTNTLNDYEANDVAMDKQARYEKLYRKYKDLPHPKVTAIQAAVDIFPEQRRLAIKGSYAVQNKSAAPLDTLRLQVDPTSEVRWLNLPPHQVVLDDKEAGFSILKLATPLAPGQQMTMEFSVDVRRPGFTNSGRPDSINLNGTFFNNAEQFPHFGYQDGLELRDRSDRRKRGLGEPVRMAKLEDEAARANSLFGGEADWVSFDTTVSTSGDQTAVAPGYLQKRWTKDGRNYFHYKMDQKMLPFFAYQSARWEIKKADWKGIPIEVYYDKKHGYNVERMITATQKSLAYYSAQYTPYQHKQVRILEFPRYQEFAQAFANTIPFSEGIGFIADLRDKEAIDYVFFVTAHEVAHQWWGHQVVGANVQGSTMLIESLAEYSALMVMEKEYGRDKLRRFLRYDLDRYLSGRAGEAIEEQPLYRVENQPYIHYRKGSLTFYRLRDEIGEEALNRALKRFLQDKGYQESPFTTSAELLQYIRAETPPEKQSLVTDLFEKIVFYDNRVTEAKAVKRPDGRWDVTLKLHIAKLEADGKGTEKARAYDEPVEIGVFARADGAKEADERVLYLEKRVLSGSDPSVTITVKDKPFDVGVDPYNKMIDRVATDNRKEVSID